MVPCGVYAMPIKTQTHSQRWPRNQTKYQIPEMPFIEIYDIDFSPCIPSPSYEITGEKSVHLAQLAKHFAHFN